MQTDTAPVTPRSDEWAETLRRLRAFVAARVDDTELAADIAQDVIVRSLASGSLATVDNPMAWLYRSARNAVIDHYRTRRRNESIDDDDAWPDPDLAATDDAALATTRELAGCLRPMLSQLAPAAREALTRVDIEGETQQSAADSLGISVSGMKSRVQRARRDLRELLEGCCAVELNRRGEIADYEQPAAACGCGTGRSTPSNCG